MFILPIQATQNSKRTNFKARFVNDAEGNFRKLWLAAAKTKDLEDKARYFRNTHPNDCLEIIGARPNTVIDMEYEVFNHSNGEKSSYITKPNMPFYKTLEFILDSIRADKYLFNKEYAPARIYKLLTSAK